MLQEKFLAIIDAVPPGITGVYYISDENDRLIYIGKSNDIRKRLYQHFSNTTRKSQRMQQRAHAVAYENMGNELMALLRESEKIKEHQPIFNRAQRRSIFLWGLYLEQDEHGYNALILRKLRKEEREITAFTSKAEGRERLFQITEKYQLCQKINGLYPTNQHCFQYSIRTCKGACIQKESTQTYNARVKAYVDENFLPPIDQTILLEGRDENEKGVVWIENGIYRGYGFCGKEVDTKREIHSIINPKSENRDTQRLIKGYLRKQHSPVQSFEIDQ
ncbi:GIY-YIG nuclease family protein [Echinicola sp. CAU 1574]|uniref:Excinuclease cho n=2 Tax=Echinicola arenosa TaxID=2774144 RepID=A0ABR9ASW5_9BACT|nr:GIY-YIG nuclease family protein [Echinicola arenosa]